MLNVVKFIIAVFLSILYRVEITGRENIPAKGAALLCANHNGELDMFFIGSRIKRVIRWMAKVELFKNPILGFFMTWVGAFPVKRGTGDVSAIKTSLKLLREGHIVGMFLEGTRTRGKTVKAKPGGAMIAIKAGVPVLPVAVAGSYKPFSRIRVVFGKPYEPEIEKDRKYTNEELAEISQGIMQRVYSLLEEK